MSEQDRSHGGNGEIQNMREDFPRALHTSGQAVADAAAQVRRQADLIDGETPSNQAVKDAAREWATLLDQLASKGEEIEALSRQADQTGWDAAEQYGHHPHGHKWVR